MMTTISAAQVKELRDQTSLGIMDCKRALQESEGDIDKAIKILRENGELKISDRQDRETKHGFISSEFQESVGVHSLIEVNCETDFVAKNEVFQDHVWRLAESMVVPNSKIDLESEIAKISNKMGENIALGRKVTYQESQNILTADYIHNGGQVGVLIRVEVENDDKAHDSEVFNKTIKEILMHIASQAPKYITIADIPRNVLLEERSIFEKQVETKPLGIIEKIVSGKLKKFYSQVCLLDQKFIIDPDLTIEEVLENLSKELGNKVTVLDFDRFKIGESNNN